MKPKTESNTASLVIGVDIGKEVFHLVGLGADGKIAFRRKIKRLALKEGKRSNRRVLAWRGGSFIFRRARHRFLELQLQLVEQFATTLGGLPVLLAPELGDQQLVMGDHRLGAGGARLGLLSCLPLGDERHLERVDVVGDHLGPRHEPDCLTMPAP